MLRFQCAIVCVLLALCSCAADKTVANAELNFQITFPESWTVTEKTPEGSAARGMSPQADGAKSHAIVKVQATAAGERTTAQALGEVIAAQLPKRLKNFELLEKADVKIDGIDACKIAYTFDGTNTKEKLRGSVYVLVANKHGYQITTMVNKDDEPKYAKDVEAVIKSLKLAQK